MSLCWRCRGGWDSDSSFLVTELLNVPRAPVTAVESDIMQTCGCLGRGLCSFDQVLKEFSVPPKVNKNHQ